MSLTDLKKGQGKKVKRKEFTVDEFIADAENYAKGHPKIVSANKALSIQEAIMLAKQRAEETEAEAKERERRFRHATFTLSEEAIEQLNELAQGSNLAKSHIIRILINELCNKDQKSQLQKLLGSDVN